VRCFGPFDSDKAASPEFFLALGCWRRMRERECFHVVSPFVYHQACVFCIRSNRSANRKILGLQQKNSCFYNCLSFHLHQDFLSFSTYHYCWQKSRSISFHLHQDISLIFSTFVAKIRSISINKFSLNQYNCGKDKIHHIFPTPSRHFLSFRAIVQRQRSLISTEVQRKNQGCLVGYKSFVFCPELPCQRKELHEKQNTNTSGARQIPSGIAIVDNPFFS
jgi:hypothetical protein